MREGDRRVLSRENVVVVIGSRLFLVFRSRVARVSPLVVCPRALGFVWWCMFWSFLSSSSPVFFLCVARLAASVPFFFFFPLLVIPCTLFRPVCHTFASASTECALSIARRGAPLFSPSLIPSLVILPALVCCFQHGGAVRDVLLQKPVRLRDRSQRRGGDGGRRQAGQIRRVREERHRASAAGAPGVRAGPVSLPQGARREGPLPVQKRDPGGRHTQSERWKNDLIWAAKLSALLRSGCIVFSGDGCLCSPRRVCTEEAERWR